MSKEDALKILSKYIKNLINNGVPINKAYLYGSYANGDIKEDSDIDILLVSKVFDRFNDKMRAKIWSLNLREDHRIEPYAIGYNKFLRDESSPLLEKIKQEGIELQIQ